MVRSSLQNLRKAFGAPLSRQRVYIVLIREDALSDEAFNMDLLTFIKNKLDAMHISQKIPWLLIFKTDSFSFSRYPSWIQLCHRNALMKLQLEVGLAASREPPRCEEGYGQAQQAPLVCGKAAAWLEHAERKSIS